jgi:HAD superfamily hydrolase (TIGR01509 family)
LQVVLFLLTNGKNVRFKAVLFDLDGTLVEFKFKVKESRLAVIDWLSKNGFDISGFTPETKTQRIFEKIEEQCSLRRDGISFDSAWREMSNILEDFEFRSFAEAKPHPGSLTLLKRLHEDQILSAIVTNSGRRPVDSILGTFGFLPYVHLIITRDEMGKMKPEPDGLLKAIYKLRVEKSDAVYVGDSVIDVQAAKKAGLASIALSQGMSSGEILAKEAPDYLVSKIEDVEKIVIS